MSTSNCLNPAANRLHQEILRRGYVFRVLIAAMTTALLLRLLVVFHGMALGAGLYEDRIVVPMWFPVANRVLSVDTAAMQRIDSGRRFWAFVTTLPLTALTLVSLKPAWGFAAAGHTWWLQASAFTLAERSLTFAFFIPTAVRLMRPTNTLRGQEGAKAAVDQCTTAPLLSSH